jgi:hypothetical protein
MKALASRKVLACILSLMLPVAGLGEQTAKALKGKARVQTAAAFLNQGFGEQTKGDRPALRARRIEE